MQDESTTRQDEDAEDVEAKDISRDEQGEEDEVEAHRMMRPAAEADKHINKHIN